ncbi:MAG: amidohydrolase [Alphaproteobacteria bacterium]|nr:amidohydrolase [Alphaproteobacteria bacterium]
MEVMSKERAQGARLSIVDCDFHPRLTHEQMKPFLTNQWWSYLQTYGSRQRHGQAKGYNYPKIAPQASRRDAWPPNGGTPGSDVDFCREQHLDFYGIDHAILTPLGQSTGNGDQNGELSAALASAANDVQFTQWHARDARFKPSIVVPYEDGVAAAAEVRKRASNKEFKQVFLLSRTAEAAGRKRYWPIYEAAVEAGLPVGIHAFGYGGWPLTNSGHPSFYIEEMTEHATGAQAMVTSFIMEGVFERFPGLKVVLIECGFGWLPSLGWRLDKNWKRLKDEVPHLKKAPSEYIRENFWVTTQPMEETENPDHLIEVMEWIGFDRIMFSSDYPHWDFDDPFTSLPPSLTIAQRRMVYADNARALYKL